jgi:hypothetical protein
VTEAPLECLLQRGSPGAGGVRRGRTSPGKRRRPYQCGQAAGHIPPESKPVWSLRQGTGAAATPSPGPAGTCKKRQSRHARRSHRAHVPLPGLAARPPRPRESAPCTRHLLTIPLLAAFHRRMASPQLPAGPSCNRGVQAGMPWHLPSPPACPSRAVSQQTRRQCDRSTVCRAHWRPPPFLCHNVDVFRGGFTAGLIGKRLAAQEALLVAGAAGLRPRELAAGGPSRAQARQPREQWRKRAGGSIAPSRYACCHHRPGCSSGGAGGA